MSAPSAAGTWPLFAFESWSKNVISVSRPGQYRVLPIGLDLTRLVQVGGPGGPIGKLRAALGLPTDVPLIGVLGRLVPIKDHSTLFHALLEVPGAHLVVLGDGELQIGRASCRERV